MVKSARSDALIHMVTVFDRCEHPLISHSKIRVSLNLKLALIQNFQTYPLKTIKRRRCSGIMQDSRSCDWGSIPGRRTVYVCVVQSSEGELPIFAILPL